MANPSSVCFQDSVYILGVKTKVDKTFHSGLPKDEICSKEITALADLIFRSYRSMNCRLRILDEKDRSGKLTKEELLEKTKVYDSTKIAVSDYSQLLTKTCHDEDANKLLFTFLEKEGQNNLVALWKRTGKIAAVFCQYIELLKTSSPETKIALKEKIFKVICELYEPY